MINRYMAPELLDITSLVHITIPTAIDVYAFGWLLCDLKSPEEQRRRALIAAAAARESARAGGSSVEAALGSTTGGAERPVVDHSAATVASASLGFNTAFRARRAAPNERNGNHAASALLCIGEPVASRLCWLASGRLLS